MQMVKVASILFDVRKNKRDKPFRVMHKALVPIEYLSLSLEELQYKLNNLLYMHFKALYGKDYVTISIASFKIDIEDAYFDDERYFIEADRTIYDTSSFY